jgi:TonB family protein
MLQSGRVLLLLCAFSWAHDPAASAETLPGINPVATELPRRLKLEVSFPGDVDREALVSVRFRVRADGSVSDVELLDTGFHEKRFVDEVFRAMKTAQFRPAMKDGVPLDDFIVVQRIRFGLGVEANGVTEEFRRELDKVGMLIRKGDNAGAHFHAEWMLSEKAKLLYEYAALQAQLAFTHASVGNVHRAFAAAKAASEQKSPTQREFNLEDLAPPNSASYYMLPREAVTNLLELRFRLAASKGMLLESIKAYQELAGLVKIPEQDPRARTAAAIVAALKGDKPLVAQLRVDEKGYVAHNLSRGIFSLAPREGTPGKVRLNCAGQSSDFDYQPGMGWTVPANLEHCLVRIDADPGTEFDLVEFQPGEAVAPPG